MAVVDVRSEKMLRLVDADVEVEQLVWGCWFTEGPVWNPTGEFLLFSDVPANTRRGWDERDGVRRNLFQRRHVRVDHQQVGDVERGRSVEGAVAAAARVEVMSHGGDHALRQAPKAQQVCADFGV